jgi:hypothetical protein
MKLRLSVLISYSMPYLETCLLGYEQDLEKLREINELIAVPARAWMT